MRDQPTRFQQGDLQRGLDRRARGDRDGFAGGADDRQWNRAARRQATGFEVDREQVARVDVERIAFSNRIRSTCGRRRKSCPTSDETSRRARALARRFEGCPFGLVVQRHGLIRAWSPPCSECRPDHRFRSAHKRRREVPTAASGLSLPPET